jgi:hypothetical protein
MSSPFILGIKLFVYGRGAPGLGGRGFGNGVPGNVCGLIIAIVFSSRGFVSYLYNLACPSFPVYTHPGIPWYEMPNIE